jgi:hypothetical protein
MMESKYRVLARKIEGTYEMCTYGPLDITPGDKIDIVNLGSGNVEVTIMCRDNTNAHKLIKPFEGCHGCWAYAHITSDLCDATGCSERSPKWSFIRLDNLLEEL